MRDKFLDFRATKEYRSTLQRVCDMIGTHNQLATLNNKLDSLDIRLSNILKTEVSQNEKKRFIFVEKVNFGFRIKL